MEDKKAHTDSSGKLENSHARCDGFPANGASLQSA